MRKTFGPHNLKDGVELIDSDTGFTYKIPLENASREQREEQIYDVMNPLRRGIWCLDETAKATEANQHKSAFVYASRRFNRVFSRAYEDEKNVEFWTAGVFGEISSDLNFYDFECQIPPRTIAIRNREDALELEYLYSFECEDDTLEVPFEKSQPEKKEALLNCSKSIKSRNSPYHPSIFSRWRYNPPSEVEFSFKTEGNNFVFGVNNSESATPFWYHLYSLFSIYPLHSAVTLSGHIDN